MIQSNNPQQPIQQPYYPLVMTNSSLLNMTIEIVDFSIKNGDVP